MQDTTDNPTAGELQPATTTLTLDQAMAMAVELQRQHQLPQAEAIFQAVLEVEPESANALHFLGIIRHQQGRREEAVDLIRRAIAVDPNYADAYNNLGNVLRAAEQHHEALAAFQRATELAPNMAEAHLNLAGLLRRSRRLPEAAKSFRRAVELNPTLSDAHFHLGNALHMMGLVEEAAAAFENWHQIEPDNPIAGHMAAASGAPVPERASDGYVRKSFDEFSASFDKKMETLHYCVPSLIAAAVSGKYESLHSLDILDAGCGTGLCAIGLAPYARRLAGVDLSVGMLDKARERGLYDELTCSELVAFLQTQTEAHDLIVCADTLVYFGALDAMFHAAANALRLRGRLIVTVERLDVMTGDVNYLLNPHGRYSHSETYLRRCLTEAGMAIDGFACDTLRLEMGQPVVGFIVTALKPDATLRTFERSAMPQERTTGS